MSTTTATRRLFLCFTAALACAAIAVMGARSVADDSTSGPAAAVEIKGRKFNPEKLEITAGTTVTWTNRDAASHTVESGAPDAPTTLFNAKLEGNGGTFSHKFTEPGEFPYFCGRHNSMKGTVVVKAK
jgi:plastocyanin